jgi:hypothetical protein
MGLRSWLRRLLGPSQSPTVGQVGGRLGPPVRWLPSSGYRAALPPLNVPESRTSLWRVQETDAIRLLRPMVGWMVKVTYITRTGTRLDRSGFIVGKIEWVGRRQVKIPRAYREDVPFILGIQLRSRDSGQALFIPVRSIEMVESWHGLPGEEMTGPSWNPKP